MFWFPQAAMFINRGNVNAIMHILMMAAASRHYDRHKSLCCLNTSTRSQRKRSIWLSAPLPCWAEGCVSIFLQGGKAYLILLSASVRMLIIYITGRVLCKCSGPAEDVSPLSPTNRLLSSCNGSPLLFTLLVPVFVFPLNNIHTSTVCFNTVMD